MKHTKKQWKGILSVSLIISSMLISFLYIPVQFAIAITSYPPGSLLQPSDVTSSHIRNGVIINEDVSSTAAIAGSKLNLTGYILDEHVSSTGAISVDKLATSSTRDFITPNAQTWTGVKTFLSIPRIPTSTPTNDADVVSKTYLQSQLGNSALKTPTITTGENVTSTDVLFFNKDNFNRVYAPICNAVNEINLGTTSFQKVRQGIPAMGGGKTFRGVEITAYTSSTPTDAILITITNESSGVVYATGTVLASELPTTRATTTVILNAWIPDVATLITYERTGSLNDTNKYILRTSSDGCNSGTNRTYWNGSAWVGGADGQDVEGTYIQPYTAGTLVKAQTERATSTRKWIGFPNLAVASGTAVAVITHGTVTSIGWGLTLGANYYLSSSTPGLITPITDASSTYVGYALSSSTLFIDR